MAPAQFNQILKASAVAAGFVAGGIAFGGPALAEGGDGDTFWERQMSCSARAEMVAHLNDQYREYRRGAGVHNEAGVIELYVSNQGSWTLLLTRPDGASCPLAVGEHWHDMPAGGLGESI